MEILDRLKSMVGVGAPTIALAELPGPVRSGELLRGTVILHGGDYDAPIKDVQVRLDEERLVYPTPGRPDRQFWRRLAEVVINLDGRVLHRHERLELSFELVVPADLSPTDTAIGYELFAETEVPGLNPKAELVVVVEA
ncbi:sporulation protein [Nannocystis sp.]|uniref:sporulation protein n=1 Tax=Nannocystis sp. TaxID=1962667 RepID=UPI00242423D7|nr:sporulation protein [Nannocystis sp.]MBK7825338.1 sporulation protein [Nannocystis sp.]MBK9756990.1 sporulation protein [Nannocystis sp.]